METKIIYVNSRKRIAGDDSEFSYKIDLKDIEGAKYVVALQIYIPRSYYLITSGLDTFTLTESAVDTVITIPSGAYSRTSFRNTIQTLLNNNSPNGWTYAITTPSSSVAETGKYTFTVTDNGGAQPSLTFYTTNHIYEIIGFDIGSTNTFVADSLVSVNVTKASREDVLYVKSDIVGARGDNILQEIYSNTVDFSNIVFENKAPDYYKKEIKSTNSGVYNFWITSEDGDHIQLNGLNFNMTLCFIKESSVFKMAKMFFERSLGLNLFS